MEKRGGRKLTIVLCETQGGGGGGKCYTLHLLCWHASITLACKKVWLKKFVVSLFGECVNNK